MALEQGKRKEQVTEATRSLIKVKDTQNRGRLRITTVGITGKGDTLDEEGKTGEI